MKLIISRKQENKGMMSSKKIYVLNATLELDEAEKSAVEKYELGSLSLYQNIHDGGSGVMGNLSTIMKSTIITANSLLHTQRIECSSLLEILEVNEILEDSCKNLKNLIDATAGFEAQEVIEF